MKFLHAIDNLLNKFTMYRVALYSLIIISIAAIIFSFFGFLSYNWFNLLLSATFLLFTCYFTNVFFAKIFKAAINSESSLITALILFLIMQPADNLSGILGLTLASVISMGSKYIIALHKKHIFNPAAFAAFILGFNATTAAIWWVATPVLLPFTAVLGLLIVRKIRRFQLFFSYLAPAFLTIIALGFSNQLGGIELIAQAFTSWPLIFMGTVMLTEPRTIPPTKNLQMIYGVLVGLLSGLPFSIGPVYSTPELALLVGNIYAYIVSPKHNLILKLLEIKKLAPNIYGFCFEPNEKINFTAGQYLEWTLPHNNPDARGNRRYFTIASSPTEKDIKLGVKITEDGSSSFKKSLRSLKPDDLITAGSLAGDFTLSKQISEKLVFIGGGIGITPFRSIIQEILDKKGKRDIVLFYACTTPEEFVYKEVFDKAEYTAGLKTEYVITKQENAPKNWNGKTGRINEDMIRSEVPDFKERTFYLSGPNGMVQGYKELLANLGVAKNKIVTDYFPGF